MTEERTDTQERAEPADSVEPPTPPAAPESESTRAVGRGVKILLALILLSLCWYLLADRFTPYTSQARVQGYVVGVAPKVGGVVTRVWIANNQRVKAGDKLFSIDSSEYQIALQHAQAYLENTWQQVAAGDAAVEKARADQRAALSEQRKAEQDYTRLRRLWEDDPGTISVRRLEISRANLDQARAGVAAAEAAIQQAIEQKGGGTEEANTLLQLAKAEVAQAQLDLDNTTVVAESDGVITDLRAEAGLYAAAGNPVLTLLSVEDLWISADFTENNLGHLEEGTPVEILLDALPGKVLKGKVRDIGFGVSAGNTPPPGQLPSVNNNRDWLRQAQRFPVRVVFTELPPEVVEELRIGGQASVIAYTEGHGLLQVIGKLYIRLLSYLSYAY